MKTYTIGRSNENDIVIQDQSVSRHHAQLHDDGAGRFHIVDLQSTNGVYIRDGERWVQAQDADLAIADRVMIGGVATSVSDLMEQVERVDRTATEERAAAQPAPAQPAPAQPAPPANGGDADASIALRGDTPPIKEVQTYEEYLRDKQAREADSVGKAPPPPPPRPSKARRSLVRLSWIKWGSVTAAVILLLGAATFAALEFAGDVFGPRGGGSTGAGTSTGTTGTALPPARTTWDVVLGGADTSNATAIQADADGGYVVAGFTRSKGAGGHDGWLAKLSPGGKVLWERTVGGRRDDRFDALLRTVDGGYIAVGRTNSKGKGNWDFWVVRLDATGAQIWETVLGGKGPDVARGVVALRDGGFVVAGDTHSGTKDGEGRGWLVKLDAQGKKVADYTIGTRGEYTVNAIQLTADGGYIVVGAHQRGKSGSDFWAARLSASGKVQWQYQTGGRRLDSAHAVLALRDGGFIIAGETASRGYGKSDSFLIRLNDKGKRRWARVYGGKQSEAALGITQAVKGGYVLTGYSATKSAGGRDLWVARVSASGNREWERRYGGKADEWGRGVLSLVAGGYVIAGTTSSKGEGKDNVWVIRLDADGKIDGLKFPPKPKPKPASPGSTSPKAEAPKPGTPKTKLPPPPKVKPTPPKPSKRR